MGAHLAAAPEYARCSRLVVYAALPDELPLDDALERARADGKRLLWPRVLDAQQMDFAAAERIESLREGRYGVRQPAASVPSEALGSDVLVLVPGVAFDARGGRLGRGAGFWDRTLAGARTCAVFGVGYELQIVERVPQEPHDRPVDALLTELGLRRAPPW